MEFKDRKRTNNYRRKLEIISQDANIIVADIKEEDGNVTEAGTPITAEIMNEIAQKADSANNLATRVVRLEEIAAEVEPKCTKITFSQTSPEDTVGTTSINSDLQINGNIYLA